MKKYFLLFLIMLLSFINIKAQVTDKEKELKEISTDTTLGWKKGGVVILNLSQTSLSNWAAGGQSAVSGNTLINLFMNHKKPNSSWDNSLNLGLGMQYQVSDEKLIKTDDKIDFTSKYGQKATKNLYYAFLLNFKTQFAVGYNYPNDSIKISDFLAPAYLVTALGMDYKPNAKISVFVAPVTGRVTFVMDEYLANQGSFGVEKATYDTSGKMIKKGVTTKTEFGGYIRLLYKNDNILKNTGFYSRLDLFSNYLNNPGNIDVNWESILAIKLAKYFSAIFTFTVVYDDDVLIATENKATGKTEMVGPRTQIKEVFGFGFSYKF